MSDPNKLGVPALEGPAARMGRRGSFQPMETSTINLDQTFGTGPKAVTSSFDLGNFDFVKSMTSTDPSLAMFTEKAAEDNPMKYKRTVRRVSLISSDGTFQMDFLHSKDNNQKALVTQAELQKAAPANVTVVVEDHALAVPSATPRGRRGSLVDLLEDQNIRAADVPAAKPAERDEPAKGIVGAVLNSWFFRNPHAEEEEMPTMPQGASATRMEGVGDGQLTKVISVLGMKGADPEKLAKDSRKMNMWMPQGM